MTPRFVARQLAHPSGMLGRMMERLMNRRNARMNAFAVEQLELRPADRVLEIGFGGGVNLPRLIQGAGYVAGVDPSRDVVRHASTRFAGTVAAGRAIFRVGSVEAIPFELAQFGKICTVNTVYFWKSLDAGFSEIRRVLAPGGRVAVGFLPKEWMDRLGVPDDIFTPRVVEDVVSAMRMVGFHAVRVQRPHVSTAWNVIVANR